ncbi:MAG TPA: hypothetical protein P5331_00400, partial [Candidatus Syntrophosphaera sp.]|nr:hypothetical protein [Candidatus Syntrophosphaera sp.]
NPQGMAANILRPSGLSFIADNENPEDIAKSIVNLYNLWQEEKLAVMPNWDYIRSFERRELTRKLAGVFDQTLDKISTDPMNNLKQPKLV